MKRLPFARLLELGASLGESEREVIRTLARLHLMSHAQLAALLGFENSETSQRLARRILKRLNDDGMLARLERRIGGIRAGSAGYIYYLGPAGQRLVAYWDGQGLARGRYRPEPGSRYVLHRLAVSQLYVDLKDSDREGLLDLLTFDGEPDCWRTFGDRFGGTRTLKPDGFVRVGLGAYEDRYFVEVDLGSESRSVIGRKLRFYLDYFNTGAEQHAHGVFPRVLLLTNSEERRAALVMTCERLPAEAWRLFTITALDKAVAVFSGQYGDQAELEAEALS
jgi:hypothetical protein